MKRKIKFEAWSPTKKQMGRVLQMHLEDNGEVSSVLVQFPGHQSLTNVFELREWTGFVDNKGKDIYEGDICRVFYDGKKIVAPFVFNTQKAQFGMDATVDFIDSPDHIELEAHPEILGNIYQNPELLA